MNRHIRQLHQSLARTGQDVVLRRLTGTTNQVPNDVTVRAHIRDYAVHELGGTMKQGDSKVIIGVTEINDAQWPGGHPATDRDLRIPLYGDRIIYDGRTRVLTADAKPFYADGELVRIEMVVRG